MLFLLQSRVHFHSSPNVPRLPRMKIDPIIIPLDEDDDILIAWFMLMRQNATE